MAGLAGVHQRSNASLAIALVQAFLASPNPVSAFKQHTLQAPALSASSGETRMGLKQLQPELLAPAELSEYLMQGLKNARWPGRCQKVEDREPFRKGVTWFLDGAHTVESLQCCAEWFVQEASTARKYVFCDTIS